MSTLYEELTAGPYTAKIFYDEDQVSNPREFFEPLSKMVCFHGRYSLGDRHQYKQYDYDSFDELERAIRKEENVAAILPLYLYDHSGITISTSPFGDRWDSGQVGFVYVTKEALYENFNTRRATQNFVDRTYEIMENEVKLYDDYLRGDVFGFVLYENGEEIDSSWTYFGSDFEENGLLDALPKEFQEKYCQKV